MSRLGVWYFILWIHYLALTLWIGGITIFSGIVAPAIHRSMASRAVAGEIVAKILKRFNMLEVFCFLLLIATLFSASIFISGDIRFLWYLIFTVLTMGIFTAYYSFHLRPQMENLREKIPTLDALSETNSVKTEFDRLHRIYVKLMSINLVLGMVVLYGSVVFLK